MALSDRVFREIKILSYDWILYTAEKKWGGSDICGYEWLPGNATRLGDTMM